MANFIMLIPVTWWKSESFRPIVKISRHNVKCFDLFVRANGIQQPNKITKIGKLLAAIL